VHAEAEAEAPRAGTTPNAAVPIAALTPRTDPDVRPMRLYRHGTADAARCFAFCVLRAFFALLNLVSAQCAMVRRGMALNPSTDKLIKIGGAVFNKLVATEGYKLNRSTGELERSNASAPPAARRGADAATPSSAVAPRRLAMEEDETREDDAAPRFASQRAASPQARRAGRAEAVGRSPPPAARRRSGRA